MYDGARNVCRRQSRQVHAEIHTAGMGAAGRWYRFRRLMLSRSIPSSSMASSAGRKVTPYSPTLTRVGSAEGGAKFPISSRLKLALHYPRIYTGTEIFPACTLQAGCRSSPNIIGPDGASG
jgi:hypothetical protein